MAYDGVLLFEDQEYRSFMACDLAVAYDPDLYEFDGRTAIVNEFEIEQALGNGRYLVQKKWG